MKRHYLLTGATGAVGSAILKHLLKNGETVVAPIRADSEAHLLKRAQKLIDFCGIKKDQKSGFKAIKAFVGKPQFGLNDSEYKHLTDHCTHIIHCAANVNLNQNSESAVKETRAITVNMLNFFDDLKQAGKMEFVSTVGVAGKEIQVLEENWVDENQEFRNAYEQAKAAAEQQVKEKIENGCKITIHRPSMVIGDSETGAIISYQVFYFLCEFLSGRHTLGFLPQLKGFFLDTVPADYLARVIYLSSLKKEFNGRILHICSGGESIDLEELKDLVIENFKQTKPLSNKTRSIPLPFFKAVVYLLGTIARGRAKKSLKTLPLFLDYLESRQQFSNKITLEFLSSNATSLPAPKSCITKAIEYYLNNLTQK